MLKKTILLSAVVVSSVFSYAQQYGGMWIPTELNEKEMKKMGMKISAKDIFNTKKPSIKDAVVQFNGGCTAEIISPKGLLLTNHHCGYGQIQAHSSVENDYLTNGFWAKNNAEELPNPGVTVDFIVDIKEVTDKVLKNTKNLSGQALDNAIKNNIRSVQQSFPTKGTQKVMVKSMYAGNKYYAFVIDTFKDIRLVGAPPSSIGKFGSDTDNWVWPRHTGDFSMFRIYADKNNQPAEYSKDNVPFQPKYFLPISIKEKNENDFTFVYGFPGRTNEYLPSIAIEKIVNEIDPAMISVREVALKTLDEKMRADKATKIKYASKYARIANYWKKWIGEVEGLKKSNAVAKKRAYENRLGNQNKALKNTIQQFEELYNAQAPYALNNAYYGEVVRNAETLRLANLLINFVEMTEDGTITDQIKQRYANYLAKFYKNYDAQLDAKVTAKVLALYQNKNKTEFLPQNFGQFADAKQNLTTMENWSKNSIITGSKDLNGNNVNGNLMNLFHDADFIPTLKKDQFYQLALAMKKAHETKVSKPYKAYKSKINALQKKYIAQLMKTDKNRKFFPDANSTMRVTYGKIAGSNPRDAVRYDYQTHISGIMEKYVPNDYEFDVPAKLIQLYNTKDYGIYTDKTGEVPVGFTATNHTTGGNSGSPALDAHGNLIGLNFDRQWEGTMSDINYDPKLCRNIMVDTRYILFIIDKYADSKWLIDEMKIVK
ncbi:MAG: serine protease [Flavobacteriales bacterium]|nr:MAG: serine protease [Flavobacteriales bacterium]